MAKRVRVAVGLIILALSLSLLAWSLWPTQRESRVVPIPPAELVLPTP